MPTRTFTNENLLQAMGLQVKSEIIWRGHRLKVVYYENEGLVFAGLGIILRPQDLLDEPYEICDIPGER